MATKQFVIRVNVAWWLKPYMVLMCAICTLLGREPNWVKFERVVDRAISVERTPSNKMEIAA